MTGYARLAPIWLAFAASAAAGLFLAPALEAQDNPMAAPIQKIEEVPEPKEEPEPQPVAPKAGQPGPQSPAIKYPVVVAPLPPVRPYAPMSVAPAAAGVKPPEQKAAEVTEAPVEPEAKAEVVVGPTPVTAPVPPIAFRPPTVTVEPPAITAPPETDVEPEVDIGPNMRVASLTVQPQAATTEEIEAEESRTPEPMLVEKQTDSVNIACLQPELLRLVRIAGEHFKGTPVITSGQRDRGRRGSYHRKCMAADFFVPGIERSVLAKYLRSLPEAGGVGTYCHTKSVHIDIGEPRNWYQCGFRFRFAQR